METRQGRSWRADLPQMILLTALYFLQGLPMGLVFGSLPFLLKSVSSTSYSDMAIFSLASYPYSLKLLWSPIVDSVYSTRVGRRKSWIIPAQSVSAITFLLLAPRIPEWISAGSARVGVLTAACLFMITLAATQDIALDGWALTMLSDANKAYASTCQSLGLTPGFFVSFTIFLAVNDANFCSLYIWRDPSRLEPLVSLEGFLYGIGCMYVAMTLLVIVLPREKPPKVHEKPVEVYQKLRRVIKLPSVISLATVLVLARIAFSAHDSATSLKLAERGLPRRDISFIQVAQLPFDIWGTIYAGRRASKSPPLRNFLFGWALRLALVAVFPFLVYYFPEDYAGKEGGEFTLYFVVLLLGFIVYQFASDSMMFVSMGTFFVRIADDSIGGTYLTLLNTIANLGGIWPRFFVLALIDKLTLRDCSASNGDDTLKCTTTLDGYYVSSAICVLTGCLLYPILRQRLMRIGDLSKTSWRASAISTAKTA